MRFSELNGVRALKLAHEYHQNPIHNFWILLVRNNLCGAFDKYFWLAGVLIFKASFKKHAIE